MQNEDRLEHRGSPELPEDTPPKLPDMPWTYRLACLLFPRRVITDICAESGEIVPYLTRFYLTRRPRPDRSAFYLHYFHRSDADRALHDHPWKFTTFLLSSGYYEHIPRGRVWVKRFTIKTVPAKWRHRVEVVKPTWTIIWRRAEERNWGFWIAPTKWVRWQDYGKSYCND